MVQHTWIINCLQICKISYEVINFIEKNMKIWRFELAAGGRNLFEAKFQRDIFQGVSLSPLLFIITLRPFKHIENALSDTNLFNRKKKTFTECTWTTSNCLEK